MRTPQKWLTILLIAIFTTTVGCANSGIRTSPGTFVSMTNDINELTAETLFVTLMDDSAHEISGYHVNDNTLIGIELTEIGDGAYFEANLDDIKNQQ